MSNHLRRMAASKKPRVIVRAIIWGTAIGFIIGLAGGVSAQTAVHIHDVLRSPGQFSEHDIAVFGHVHELSVGQHYTTFKICGARCLNVLAWGHPRISDHEALSVRGRFHLLKEIDHQKVRNLIEVQRGSL